MQNRLQNKNQRTGATLVEVLMSLLIFSVGIVSVFTLFPVSLLSSIQATKLTNSKILSDNVVELIRTNPGYLRPPGGAASDVWKGIWEPNIEYSVGDLVWPEFDSGALYPIPNIAFRCTGATSATPPNPPVSGSAEPNWVTTGTVSDGDLEWTPILSNGNFVVDPLGRFIDGAPRANFGYNNAVAVTGLARTAGGGFTENIPTASPAIEEFMNYSDALQAFSQPDSWTVVFEEIPASVNNTSVTFPAGIDLSGISASNHRVIVTSPNGRVSAVRPIQNQSGQTITLDTAPPSSNLPGTLNSAAEVGKVRIESFNPRYSYFLTVRRPSAFEEPTISAVVVFNRSFSVDDEEVYDANFGNSSYSDDTTVQDGGLGTDQLKVAWDGENAAPLMREGNYVFDARNVLWYQITNIQRDNANENAVLTLDRSVEVLTVDTGTPADSVGRAIFLPGIVKVFEL